MGIKARTRVKSQTANSSAKRFQETRFLRNYNGSFPAHNVYYENVDKMVGLWKDRYRLSERCYCTYYVTP